jgi:hypothetical protein
MKRKIDDISPSHIGDHENYDNSPTKRFKGLEEDILSNDSIQLSKLPSFSDIFSKSEEQAHLPSMGSFINNQVYIQPIAYTPLNYNPPYSQNMNMYAPYHQAWTAPVREYSPPNELVVPEQHQPPPVEVEPVKVTPESKPKASARVEKKKPAPKTTTAKPKKKPKKVASSSEDEHSTDDASEEIPPVDVSTLNFEEQQPIRVLAYQIGLSKDPNKNWRYRDTKRALFDKMPKDQVEFIDKEEGHNLLQQRLPHKLSLVGFAKRIMLIVYHFIVRDGRAPKFWRKGSANQKLIEKILSEFEPEFYEHVNALAAYQIHSYMVSFNNIYTNTTRLQACP